jgi:hypothetical protein
MKGLVVFSFALRAAVEEPNPCNVRLASVVRRIVEREVDQVVVVAQWEVALQLRQYGIPVARVVTPRSDGAYLDSKQVWEQARAEFWDREIDVVIPVAQPFLHLHRVRQLMEADGFSVGRRRIGWIGFDRRSTQPWTRGPVRLLLYAMRQWGAQRELGPR